MSVFHPVSSTRAERKLRTGLSALWVVICATTLGIASTAAAATSKTVTLVLTHALHPKAAQHLLAFMVGTKTQRMLAHNTVDFEYSHRSGISANPQLKPFDQLQPPDISVSRLGNDREALQLLREAGLL